MQVKKSTQVQATSTQWKRTEGNHKQHQTSGRESKSSLPRTSNFKNVATAFSGYRSQATIKNQEELLLETL
jgi:TFIIF-interacting CTD phosphatase-like protein